MVCNCDYNMYYMYMQALPNIKEYLQSDSCIKRPMLSPVAQWN